MIKFESEIEKKLWRGAVLKALGNVDEITPSQHREATKFAIIVADGVILAYRERHLHKNGI